jgi:putative membrane protein
LSGDEMGDMAGQCAEMMRTMGGMMGMHGASDMPMGGMSGMGGMGSMMIGGLVLPALLLLAVIVLLAVLLIRRPPGREARAGSPARAELDRRYARGNIDRETYLQMRRDLQGARS